MTRYGPLVPVNAAVIYEALPNLDEHCAPIAPYRWDELAPRSTRPRSSEGGRHEGGERKSAQVPPARRADLSVTTSRVVPQVIGHRKPPRGRSRPGGSEADRAETGLARW
jgi:hypothetical protein